MGRRTGVTADETRQELLDATIEVLRARGMEGARVAEIARVAGVTPAAIYNHFASKTELVTAAIADQAPATITAILADDADGSVLDAFRALGARVGGSELPLAPLLLELVVASTRDPEVAALVGGGVADREAGRADVIRGAQLAGEIDGGLDSEALARFTTVVALGALVASALELKPIDQDAWDPVLDRLLTAVRADPASTTIHHPEEG